jgi:NAD+ diphosphatase
MSDLMSTFQYAPDLPTFTGMTLDRAMSEREDPDAVSRLLGDPAARLLAASGDGVLVGGAEGPSLLRAGLTPESEHEPILLGLEDGVGVFAAELDELAPSTREELTGRGEVVSLREAGAALSHPEAGLAAYLMALLNWHRRHRFCANCGNRTQIREAGYSRRCPNCGAHHFPRTDPVVIMTVEHDRRMLLGHRTGWPEGRYSILAGFVSPGEAAEEAVVREVREESGILARDPRFVSSQPWPFPSSLMLGFEARSDGGEPRATDDELDDVRWFTRQDVIDGMNGRNPALLLPPSISIARFLLERWVAASA